MKNSVRIEAIIPPDDCVAFEQSCQELNIKYRSIDNLEDGMHIKIKLGEYIKAIENIRR